MTQRDPKETALSFYNNTYESNHKQYLSIISAPDFGEVRKIYLSLFEWTPSVLESLRILTEKLFFKGESQHIDTILQDFAESWSDKYHGSKLSNFGNTNGVYLVSYSLILLNTDLHTADGARKRISKADYVKNTLSALASNHIVISDSQLLEADLRDFYDQLLNNELILFGSSRNSKKTGSGLTSDSDTNSLYSSTSSSIVSPSLNPATARSFGFASALANERSLKKQHSRESFGSAFTSSASTVKTGMTSSQLSNLNEIDNESDVEEESIQNLVIEEEGDLELELDGPPWIKEGLVNVVMIDNEQDSPKQQSKFNFLKSKPTNFLSKWRNAFVVVSKGEMRLFSFDSPSSSAPQQQQQQQQIKNKKSMRGLGFGNSSNSKINLDRVDSSSLEQPVGAGNWYDTALCLGTFNLAQTYASKPTEAALQSLRMIRSEPARNMGHVYWSLTLPLQHASHKKHTKLIFQCGSEEIAREFIETCNFWGARSTSIPSENTSVTSYEYGWSKNMIALIDTLSEKKKDPAAVRELNAIKITDWSPLLTSNFPTNLVMSDQLAKLKTYQKSLKAQLEEHQATKPKLDTLYKLVRENKGLLSQPVQTHQSSFSLRRRQEPPQTQQDLAGSVRMILNNYNKKLNYLNRELLRYKKYINSLTNAIKMRQEKLKEDENAQDSDASDSHDVSETSKQIYEDDEFGGGGNKKIIMVGTD